MNSPTENGDKDPTTTGQNGRESHKAEDNGPTLATVDSIKDGDSHKPTAAIDPGRIYFSEQSAAKGPLENNAPKSLDHFKRGHKERTSMREREASLLPSERPRLPPQVFAERTSTSSRSSNRLGRRNSSGSWGHSRAPNNHRRPSTSRNQEGGRGGGYRGNNPRRRDSYGGGGESWPPSILGFSANEWMVRNAHHFSFASSSSSSSSGDKRHLDEAMEEARKGFPEAFKGGKAMTALIATAARKRQVPLARYFWEYMDRFGLPKNVFHYNAMLSVAEKDKNLRHALDLLREMEDRGILKNEITFSSAISACEKTGEWRVAVDLLDRMEKEGVGRSTIAYNAAISACEKGIVPGKACEVFQRMKKAGIEPSVVSYSALISAAEKGGQWKLALQILNDMKAAGFTTNVVAFSAAISAVAKGQQWEIALQLFREFQAHGGQPSIITYNATMTALEKGMQWERALGLFEEMKLRNLAITVVSYGSAISACDKGLQYRQCLEYLDEMTEMGIEKNVIIFGAAMSCMEKCCRPDISFQLMERMKAEHVSPNVHIFNSVISACARCSMWEKGYELFQEMQRVGVRADVVTYNAVLDAVASQVELGRRLFEEGIEKGFYSQVSRLGEHWFELDLHFLSLGGGEIALGWWFEKCLVPYLMDTAKLDTVQSITIVTGYGKTRTRGRRQNNDGMKKRVSAMLRFMNIRELPQANAGRVLVDKPALIKEVNRNAGRVHFDLDAYVDWKARETTTNQIPDVPQKIRVRFRPKDRGSGKPPFVMVESESTSPEYRIDAEKIAAIIGTTLDGNSPSSSSAGYDSRRRDARADRREEGQATESRSHRERDELDWRGYSDGRRSSEGSGSRRYSDDRGRPHSSRGPQRDDWERPSKRRNVSSQHRDSHHAPGNHYRVSQRGYGAPPDRPVGNDSHYHSPRDEGRTSERPRDHEGRRRSGGYGAEQRRGSFSRQSNDACVGSSSRHHEGLLSDPSETSMSGRKRSHSDYQRQQSGRGYNLD